MIESTTARSAFRTVAHDRYRRAIYVDFESLKKPPTPALLGIFTDTDGETTFAQVILDERLAAARVARQQLRAGSLARVVEELVASGLPLIGWSIFDRQLVVGDATVPTELKQEWQRLYVNALKTARAWRTIVHPTFPISRAAKFDPKHTLDQYAKLAGYPRLRFLQRAKPATWSSGVEDGRTPARPHIGRGSRSCARTCAAPTSMTSGGSSEVEPQTSPRCCLSCAT